MCRERFLWVKTKQFLLSLYRLFVRIRVIGRERVTPFLRGGVVVAANHLTGADSIVIQIALRVRIFFIAWARWFHSRFVGFWMKNLCDTMPVINGVAPENVATLRQSLALLKSGAKVGIYPEGELNRQGGVDHVHNGTAWLALHAQVPILPVYVSGLKLGPAPYSRPWLTEAWEGFFSVVGNLLNRNIIVLVGEPILPPPRVPDDGQELKQEIARINQELLRQFDRLRRISLCQQPDWLLKS